ncbi:ATP-grasp domain-containing protein [Exiguobacterium sp. s55]|uniref:ATP-grasp domain-containing protein n=1 Tax=Exiguobacterium sp. s55 TaxID=2751245 RepID=UPI001BE64E91|nr:ATP-grasp domain-containing protein [Exiguobacterium sp. s55]
MKKSILVLGAGVYQVPLIQKVKEMGYSAIVTSIEGNYPGFDIADKKYFVNTTDKEKILDVAIKENVAAVVTTGTDVPIQTQGYINDTLNLIGISEQTGKWANDKLLMKQKFIDNNVNTSRFLKVKNLEEATQAFESLEKPLIFKAVDSSGSRGIIKVEVASDISFAVREVFKVTKKDYFVVEEFVEGKEFGAQALIQNGKIVFCLTHDDDIYWSNTGVPIGHSAPMDLPENILDTINDEVEKACRALKIDNSALNVDFIMRDDKIFILEIGARAGATCLPELISISYETDFYKHIVDVALGNKIKIDTSQVRANASMLLYSEVEGKINKISNENSNDDFIYDISFDYSIGDKVNKFRVGPDRIGQVVVKGKNLEEAKSNLNSVLSKIDINVSDKV